MTAGRPRNLKSTEELSKLFEAYKENLDQEGYNWLKIQYVGKDGDRVQDPQRPPMTLEGFKRFCRNNGIKTIEQYFTNQDGLYEEYIGICSHIREEIRENQIVGGMLGFYNSSITQRLNGLVDKTEIDVKTEPRVFNINPDSE